MRTQRRTLRLLPALLAALLLASGFRAAAQSYTAPMELLRTGHIAVQVRVNGQGPFRLILDTGSPLTFISMRSARQLGLIPPRQGSASKPGMLAIGGQVVLKSLSVGSAEIKSLDALILDHPIVEALGGLEGRLDGIVGFSFFARFHTTIDYLNSRVTFAPVEYTPQDVMNGMMSRLFGGPKKARVIAPSSLWGLAVAPSVPGDGVLVTRIYPDSAAATAGFQPGDRITILDDRWTDTVNDLYEAASLIVPSLPVVVKVVRSGKETLLTVRPMPGI